MNELAAEKLLMLIKESKALKPEEKVTYLVMVKFLSDEKRNALIEIFEKEKNNLDAGINAIYAEKIKRLFKVEEKKAISEEEKEEDAKSEDILTQLNDL